MLTFQRYFTVSEPFLLINHRTAVIKGKNDEVKFKQEDVEAPAAWSDTAVSIMASKCFHGQQGMPDRETSVLDVITRITKTITEWGIEGGYFDEENGKVFREELYHLLIHQKAAFNSPVWFNVGVPNNPKPQTSACFILGIEDNIESIVNWYGLESLIFKHGSGAGINISPLRSAKEYLSYGGRPSGPLSFMRAADSCAGVIKSGGKVRRAAKLVCMDDNHPDLLEFIASKVESKRQAEALRSAGFDWEIGDDSLNIPYTNSNHAVRLTNAFMDCAYSGADWPLINRTDHKVNRSINAEELLFEIAKAVHYCGDPGVMFHDTINLWNTCRNERDIKAANPCCEFNWFDGSSCNLASIKLTAFQASNGDFDFCSFRQAIELLITAQDIIIDRSSYPNKQIEANSKRYRPLGLGFTDLGALLMRAGLPYDSEEARNEAALIASFMTGAAYLQSRKLAEAVGASAAFERNAASISYVISEHHRYCCKLDDPQRLARDLWEELDNDTTKPIRNMQLTLLAPTGTISFIMDADTTGIEPELALVKYKQMVGGGILRIVNKSVEQALFNLSYGTDVQRIMEAVERNGTIEGNINEKHLPIFDCAFKAEGSERCLTPKAHLDMMAAIQPHISGAISKTVNLPKETTPEAIRDLLFYSHTKGIKAVTFYRDGSRYNQPLSTNMAEAKEPHVSQKDKNGRRKLSAECLSVRQKFRVGSEKGYFHVGLYEEGDPGELFITINKEGSAIGGLMDTIATLTSIALQYGVPLEVLCSKFAFTKFEPSGFTQDVDVPFAHSIVDFIFRKLAAKYLKTEPVAGITAQVVSTKQQEQPQLNTGEFCPFCGNPMTFTGKCFTCPLCGETSGCS